MIFRISKVYLLLAFFVLFDRGWIVSQFWLWIILSLRRDSSDHLVVGMANGGVDNAFGCGLYP